MAVYYIIGSALGGRDQELVNVPTGANVDECVKLWIAKENRRLKRRFGSKHLVTFTLHKIGGAFPGIEGIDQWGKFYKMTGLEAVGHCFWCGVKIRSRYCSYPHRIQYLKNFNWPNANAWCWRRYCSQCGMCGLKYSTWKAAEAHFSYRTYEVHHIEPMNAMFRTWSLMNRPQNLILLCPECHNLTKAKGFDGLPKPIFTNQLILM